MRPIKFRAWDGKNKKMYTNNHIVIYLGEVFLEDASLDAHCIHIKKEDIELVPMQWTGLLDKNGKEIYEGDIISVKMGKRTKMSVIEWVQKSPRYDYEEEYSSLNGYVKFGNFEQKSLHPDGSAFALHEGNFEVIGNIYENPDLLSK